MRLNRFRASKLNGFLDFDIKFNKDLTFLTGINGSGKTTVLNAIVALITPSLYIIANTLFNTIRIDFDINGKKQFIAASKDNLQIVLS